MVKKVFISDDNFKEAEFDAKLAGYKVVGRARSKIGDYIVFGRIMNKI